MYEESNIFKGLMNGVIFSIPLWMSLIGWLKLFQVIK